MTNDIHIFYKMDKTPGWLLNYIVIGVECHEGHPHDQKALLSPDEAEGHTNNLERLFYSNQLRIGKAVLPQANVRSRLWDLDATVLQAVQARLQRNQRDVKSSTAYVMAVIFNTICEAQSDLLVDPYLNGLNGPDG